MRGFSCAEILVLDFTSALPSVVKSIKQRDLLNTWLRLYARQQTVPAIWEYQPARLEEELSDLIYFTVDDSTPTARLTIQSEGTRISRAYGHTGKGILLDDYVGPRLAPFVMPVYQQCVARGLPVYSVADVDDIYGRVVAYERLLLPFLTDDKVSHIIASLKTFCEDGGFEIKNLLRGNDAPPRPKLSMVIDRDLFHRAPGRIAAAGIVEFAEQSGGPDVSAEIVELN
ncbi:PAS domain-containing protein [Bradyrhizobium sp. Gha]|uniref:PAS domain-containing protein n=1 Tax=Bradyrhizobium sp. Gha TaxID=1855318 RepID=UPI0008EB95D7|nr:PAS domain-containing protein [Bradyrhizobium sp. Gha]SFJ49539.1 PAS domain-containing protein [Bradyrhizobium sp. Gha]